MFWEFISTIFAGLGGAGIALLIRHLTKKKAPVWFIPAFAGFTMLSFQILGEYDWYPHQASLLPKGVVVVKTVQEKTLWRPWSYIYPQTVRFIAADVGHSAINQRHPSWVLVDLYFFERHHSAKRVTQVIDCKNDARSNFFKTAQDSTFAWHKLKSDDPILTTVCAGIDTAH